MLIRQAIHSKWNSLRSPTKSIYNYIYMSEGTCRGPKLLDGKIIYYWFFFNLFFFFKQLQFTGSFPPQKWSQQQGGCAGRRQTGGRNTWSPNSFKRNDGWHPGCLKTTLKKDKGICLPCLFVKASNNSMLMMHYWNMHCNSYLSWLTRWLNFIARKNNINICFAFSWSLRLK